MSTDVLEAPPASCALPPTVCDDASCPIQIAVLAREDHACATSPTEPTATLRAISGLVVAGDRAWIRADDGRFARTDAGWSPDARPADDFGTLELVLGPDEWRMPPSLVLTECHTPTVHCRSGGPRKCAAPRPECVATPRLLLAVHGEHDTRITMPNPLAGGDASAYVDAGNASYERLVSMAGTSANDVWVLSTARLFHWDGQHVVATALDAEDPIVRLISDASGVYAGTRAGRRLAAIDGAWQPLPDQPGPFLGQRIEAPAHPYVTLDDARATGPDAFWALGHARTFGGRFDAAPAVVRYEHGAYRTWVGAISQRTWLRADDGEVDTLHPEVFSVLVADSDLAPGAFPFAQVLWQQPRDAQRLASGALLVATPIGAYVLSGAQWTREIAGEVGAIAASGDLVAALGNGALQLREPSGWCAAMQPPRSARGGTESLAVAHGRAWLVVDGRLYAVRPDHTTLVSELRVDGATARVEQVLADGLDLLAVGRTDAGAFVTRFDGTTWSAATSVTIDPGERLVGSSATELRAGRSRFDGSCWSRVLHTDAPLLEVAPDARVHFTLVGTPETELVMRTEER